METKHIVNEMFTDIERGKFDKANNLLSDNFKSTVLDKDVNKPAYITAYRSLLKGIPDLKFNVHSIRSDGNKVMAKLELSGTHSKAIPAIIKGWHEIPATHKRIDNLVTDLEITMTNDKILEIKNAGSTRGLFKSLFEDYLGVDYKTIKAN
ncbi:MAG TPA: ester cyclase [Puia sp.]|jgi:predicted ester cyclase